MKLRIGSWKPQWRQWAIGLYFEHEGVRLFIGPFVVLLWDDDAFFARITREQAAFRLAHPDIDTKCQCCGAPIDSHRWWVGK